MMACSTTNDNVYGFSSFLISGLFKQPAGSDYVPLVNLIGVYFQIRDDLMNLQSPEVTRPHQFPSAS
jgi:geranylgeranyl diphosphate synthase type 3